MQSACSQSVIIILNCEKGGGKEWHLAKIGSRKREGEFLSTPLLSTFFILAHFPNNFFQTHLDPLSANHRMTVHGKVMEMGRRMMRDDDYLINRRVMG